MVGCKLNNFTAYMSSPCLTKAGHKDKPAAASENEGHVVHDVKMANTDILQY